MVLERSRIQKVWVQIPLSSLEEAASFAQNGKRKTSFFKDGSNLSSCYISLTVNQFISQMNCYYVIDIMYTNHKKEGEILMEIPQWKVFADIEFQTCDSPTQIFFDLQPYISHRIWPFHVSTQSGPHDVILESSLPELNVYLNFSGRRIPILALGFPRPSTLSTTSSGMSHGELRRVNARPMANCLNLSRKPSSKD